MERFDHPTLPMRNPPPAARRPRWRRATAVVALLLAALVLTLCAATPLGEQARALAGHLRAATPTTTRAAVATRTAAQEVAISTPTIPNTVDWYVANMTLDEKLGQMIMVETQATSYDGDLAAMIDGMHAGAVIIYKRNMQSPQQLQALISTTQAHAKIPAFVTIDEEGGNVDRMGDLQFAAPLPSARSLEASGDPQKAFQAGVRAATELKALGFNVDLAPVADVRSIPDPIIGQRIFSSDPATVSSFAGAFLDGLQQNGVVGTLKHWPGIGSVALDPHKTLPIVTRTHAQLESADFATFKALLPKQPGMIMVTHVLVNAIDASMPSSLSPKMVQGVLRDELGYQGVIITDNLWMKGVSIRYSLGQAAVLAILAGDDLLEGPWDASAMRGMVAAMRGAVQSGRISQERVDQSVRRILTLKAQYGILPLRQPAPDVASGSAPHALTGVAAITHDIRLPRPLLPR